MVCVNKVARWIREVGFKWVGFNRWPRRGKVFQKSDTTCAKAQISKGVTGVEGIY